MEVGDRGTEGTRAWPRACGAASEKPLGYQGCCDSPDGGTSDSAAVNESIGEGPTEITNPRAAPCRTAHRPGKASGPDVPRQGWTGSAPQRALVPNEEPPGARARALGTRAGLEVSARGYAAEGPFKCRRSRVIKKPAPGLLFNHLPLKRLPAGCPPLGALGNSGGRRGWLVYWKRRADPGSELRCAARAGRRVLRGWELPRGGEREREGWSRGACRHSPSREEKEPEVSMALWKFSSIFKPSSIFAPAGQGLPGGPPEPVGAGPRPSERRRWGGRGQRAPSRRRFVLRPPPPNCAPPSPAPTPHPAPRFPSPRPAPPRRLSLRAPGTAPRPGRPWGESGIKKRGVRTTTRGCPLAPRPRGPHLPGSPERRMVHPFLGLCGARAEVLPPFGRGPECLRERRSGLGEEPRLARSPLGRVSNPLPEKRGPEQTEPGRARPQPGTTPERGPQGARAGGRKGRNPREPRLLARLLRALRVRTWPAPDVQPGRPRGSGGPGKTPGPAPRPGAAGRRVRRTQGAESGPAKRGRIRQLLDSGQGAACAAEEGGWCAQGEAGSAPQEESAGVPCPGSPGPVTSKTSEVSSSILTGLWGVRGLPGTQELSLLPAHRRWEIGAPFFPARRPSDPPDEPKPAKPLRAQCSTPARNCLQVEVPKSRPNPGVSPTFLGGSLAPPTCAHHELDTTSLMPSPSSATGHGGSPKLRSPVGFSGDPLFSHRRN